MGLIQRLVELETQFCLSKDPYERHSLVEAYKELKNFKLWLDELTEIII